MTEALEAPARKDLMRALAFTLTRDAATGTDGLTLDGYAAVFGQSTRIDSWEGCFDETVARGAFKKSLSERTPVLQFDHGSHPMVGSIPLGRIQTIAEDTNGLHIVARLFDNWLVEPVRDAIGGDAIDGMSFRFEVVRDEWRSATGDPLTNPRDIMDAISGQGGGVPQRTLLEVKCRELGPVVFPAYVQTSVGVRSVTIDLARLHEPEQRKELARAVYMAEQANAPESTPEGAADHAEQEHDDAPQATDLRSAGEHESTPAAEPPGLRSNLSRWLRTREVVVENAMKKGI